LWSRGPWSHNEIERVTELLCNRGRLVDFGCGEGKLPTSLPRYTFSDYIGYDISEVAIQRAKERVHESGLTNCNFEQCDMAKWLGVSSASLIVVEECLYYLTPPDVEVFLQHCSDSLIPGGSILVIVYSAAKQPRTLEICRRVCPVKHESIVDGRTWLTLAAIHA
jgi:trans-aconitate methyltransferase